VGTAVDGNWGPGTAAAVRTWQAARSRERTEVVAKLEQANSNPVIRAAREEIARVRRTVEAQVAESNRLIDRLRNQLGKGDTASVEAQVNEQQEKIKAANLEIESLTKKNTNCRLNSASWKWKLVPSSTLQNWYMIAQIRPY
jgi:hypothetical protein